MQRMRLVNSSVAIALLGGVMQASAVLSLPIADDANNQAGMKRIGAGVTMESDIKLYGARLTYGATDGLALFGGVGLIDIGIDGLSTEPYFQIGAQYRLPLEDDVPFDLALRAGFGMARFENTARAHGVRAKAEMDLWFINAGLLASTELDMVTVYGFAGVARGGSKTKRTVTTAIRRTSESESASVTEPAIGGGLILPFDDRISIFAELMHIDDLFISFGGRFEF